METFVDSQQMLFTMILPFYLAQRFLYPCLLPEVLTSRCLTLDFIILKPGFNFTVF